MTLRELLQIADYSTPLYLFGVDADAAEALRRGWQPTHGVTPLFIGAVAYALIGDELTDYKDRRVLRFKSEFQNALPVLVVYQRLIGSREEAANGQDVSDVAREGALVSAGHSG